MTPARLEELKKLCAEATPGPWRSESYGGETGYVSEIYTIATGDDGDRENAMTKETASFIASARTAVPELIAEVERLRAIIARHLVDYAAWNYGSSDVRCLVCFERSSDNRSEGEKYRPFAHKPDCLAFTPEGEVK